MNDDQRLRPPDPRTDPDRLGPESFRALAAAYTALPGVHDEMVDASGRIRPAYGPFAEALDAMPDGGLPSAFARAERHLREAGVFYRVYGDPGGGERPWPLAPLPLILSAADWAELSAGAVQRARLAEAVLADLYGSGRLVRDGLLPAAAMAGSPDYLRPLAGVPAPSGRHLHLYAVDVGRWPDGRWRVLSDRTQAPSGAGYALENRIALNRAFPDLPRSMNVERLAGFFRDFRDELARMNRRAEARVALFTPGPLNETYFEHAYLARYLGFLLVEGGDLAVRDGAVYVRTVSGLRRVDVLWRRLDGDFADPIELRTASRLGVPGLVEAIREGGVTVVNALGSGVLESRALAAVMPRLFRAVLGEEPCLPAAATHWGGEPQGAAAIRDGFARLVIAPAHGHRFPGLADLAAGLGDGFSAAARQRLLDALDRRGMDIVGEEPARLATMPVWRNGHLEPRPFVLRLFLAAVGRDDWVVMPGGFCRIAERAGHRGLSLQDGGASSDVWVIGEAPAAMPINLQAVASPRIRRTIGTLPSRAADNLYWLARYIERTEMTLRIIRALAGRLLDAGGSGEAGVVRRLLLVLQQRGALPEALDPERAADHAVRALLDPDLAGAVPSLTGAARRILGAVRDRLAPDAAETVSALAAAFTSRSAGTMTPAAVVDEANQALRLVAAFSGLASENMNRLAGWRFQELGRRLERAAATARLVRVFADPAAPEGALDVLLELGDSQITYRTRYVAAANAAAVADLLVLDGNNPRSVAFQTRRIAEHLAALPATEVDGRPVQMLNTIRRLAAEIDTAAAEDFPLARLDGLADELLGLSEAITGRFFTARPAMTGPEDLG